MWADRHCAHDAGEKSEITPAPIQDRITAADSMDKDTETQFASAGAEEREGENEGDDPGVARRGSALRAAVHTTTHTTSGRWRNPHMAEDARPLWPQLRDRFLREQRYCRP
ncbi:hypothetical protein D1007_01305 [Hordeum vulgare]|nr:hypothetical protein D1007_01305 [Hordeum vulgare]